MKKYTFQDLIDFFEDMPEVQNALIQEMAYGRAKDLTQTSMDAVLSGSFTWNKSHKGYGYWRSVADMLRDYHRQKGTKEGK